MSCSSDQECGFSLSRRGAEQAPAECLREGIGFDLVLEIDAAGWPIGARGTPEADRLIAHVIEPLAKPVHLADQIVAIGLDLDDVKHPPRPPAVDPVGLAA